MAIPEKEIKSLYEFLEEQQEQSEQFKIENDEQANWVLRKIARIDEQLEDSRETAKREIEKIKAWLEHTEKQLNNEREYFEHLLKEYAFKMGLHEQRKRSKALPNGRFRFKKQQPIWEIKPSVVEELEQRGYVHLIRIKKEPDKSKIKKAFEFQGGKVFDPETGETIEGITVIEREFKFEVEADK